MISVSDTVQVDGAGTGRVKAIVDDEVEVLLWNELEETIIVSKEEVTQCL